MSRKPPAGQTTPLRFRERDAMCKRTVTPSKQCRECGLWFALEAFAPNPRVRDGLQARCRECSAERSARWRAENPGYAAAYNAARRSGPFEAVCADCGGTFAASRRMQVRCPDCQDALRKAQKR